MRLPPAVRRAWVNPRVRLAVVAAALVVGPTLVQLGIMRWQSRGLNRDLHRAQASYDALRDERQRLRTDAVYVEGLTRATFKVAKPGELVVPLSEDVQSRRR